MVWDGLWEQLPDVFKVEARHLPTAFMTVAGVAWIWLTALTLLQFVIAFPHYPFWLGSDFARFNIIHWPLYVTAFGLQISVAILTDRADWRRYPPLVIAALMYPIYFWLVLFSSFVYGFPKGFFRRDSGKWNPSMETVEALAATGEAG